MVSELLFAYDNEKNRDPLVSNAAIKLSLGVNYF